MRIFLVRHGQSEANVDKSVHLTKADHAIELSNTGHNQARQVASFLLTHFALREKPTELTRIWHSPYKRARDTAAKIYHELDEKFYAFHGKRNKLEMREHILLAEQQFGLFDGISDDNAGAAIRAKYPDEWEHYEKNKRFEGEFWARMPLGESKFDLACRVHQFFGTIQRDAQKHDIKNLIIVAHGSTNRAFTMMWMHYGYEWFEKERNPMNCSVRLIDDNVDKGYIFDPNNPSLGWEKL